METNNKRTIVALMKMVCLCMYQYKSLQIYIQCMAVVGYRHQPQYKWEQKENSK